MAQPAHSQPASPAMLPVLDVEAVLSRLPAEIRARVAWTKPSVETELARFQVEPLSDELLERVARAIIKPLFALMRAVWDALVTHPAGRFALEHALDSESTRMLRFLNSEDVRDTFVWCTNFLRAVTKLANVMDSTAIRNVLDDEMGAMFEQPTFRAWMMAYAAYLGALHVARTDGPPESAAELVETAFLELCTVQDALRAGGLWLDPFAGEPDSERAERTLRYARQLRETLSDADAEVLAEARVGNLR